MTVIATSFGHIRLSRIADQLHETQGSSHIEVQADGGDGSSHTCMEVLQCKTFLRSRKYCTAVTVEVLLNWILSLRSSYSVSLVQPVLPVVGVYGSPLPCAAPIARASASDPSLLCGSVACIASTHHNGRK